jgi:hypothetical protein
MADNFFGVTNTGRIRDNNEDTFLAETLPNGWIVACVIDGVGGYEGGEVAAEIARTTVQRYLQQLAPDPLQRLRDSLLQANLTIYNEKLQIRGKDQMACVVTLVGGRYGKQPVLLCPCWRYPALLIARSFAGESNQGPFFCWLPGRQRTPFRKRSHGSPKAQ